jgi:hypothetical protein
MISLFETIIKQLLERVLITQQSFTEMFSLVFPVKKGEALKLNNSVNIFTIQGRLREN